MTEHTTELPQLNTALLVDLVEFLKNNPEEHDQSRWGNFSEVDQEHVCCTSMCLAGHAVARAYPIYKLSVTGSVLDAETGDRTGKHVEEVAQRILGLHRREAHFLFHGEASMGDIERMVSDLTSGLRGNEFTHKWMRQPH